MTVVHSLIQGMRVKLQGKGICIIGVYTVPIDTDMVAGVENHQPMPLNAFMQDLPPVLKISPLIRSLTILSKI